MSKEIRVGLVGLGMLGNPIAKRILAAGYSMTVHDIRSEAVKDAVDAGATAAANPKTVAEKSDVVLTSLPSLKACEEVYLGTDGLLKGARSGQIFVETSTVPPSLVRRFAAEARKHQVSLVDAALLAKTTFHQGLAKLKANEVAAQGKLTMMMGGEAADIAKVKPVLSTFANPIFEMGPVGSGEMIKVLSNALSHAYFVVVCEVMAVAAKAGVNLQKLEEIFRNTNARSGAMNDIMLHYMETGVGKMMNIEAAIKDSQSMLELASELHVPVLIQGVNQAYNEMALQRGGAKNKAGDGELVKLFESLIGMPIRFQP